MKNYKRVHFLLDEEQYNKFEKISQKRGIPKSKLLCEWIDKYCFKLDINIIKSSKGSNKNSYFNFRLDYKRYERLLEVGIINSLKLGVVLRSIIDYGINLGNIDFVTKFNYSDTYGLWFKAGKLDLIDKILSNRTDDLSINERMLFIKCKIERGYIQEAYNIINRVDPDILNFLQKVLLRIMEAEICKYNGNIELAESILNECLIRVADSDDYNLKSEIFYQLGGVQSSYENFQAAIPLYISSLDYASNNKDLELIPKVNIRLAIAYLYELKPDKALRYIQLSEGMVNNNIYLKGIIANVLCIYYIQINKLTEAEEQAKNAIRYSDQIGSRREKLYGLRNLGKVYIAQGNNDRALFNLDLSRRLEKLFRPESNYSKSKLLELFIKSKNKPQKSFDELKNLKESIHNRMTPDLFNYFTNSAMFMNTEDKSVKEEGRIGLRKISDEGNYRLIRDYAKDVLCGNFKVLGYR